MYPALRMTQDSSKSFVVIAIPFDSNCSKETSNSPVYQQKDDEVRILMANGAPFTTDWVKNDFNVVGFFFLSSCSHFLFFQLKV